MDSVVHRNKYSSVLLIVTFVCLSGLYSDFNQSVRLNELRKNYPPQFAVLRDEGRLGNQFFEYLTARLISEDLGLELFVTQSFGDVYDRYFIGRRARTVDWNYLNNERQLLPSQCPVVPINYLPMGRQRSKVQCLRIEGFPVDIPSDRWRSLHSTRDQIAGQFQWRPHLKQMTDQQVTHLKSKYNTTTLVAVHARRTDYFTYLITFYRSFRPANASYYFKAMDYFRRKYLKPIFLVFSDDMDWCKSNLIGADIVHSGNGDADDPGPDLALMSSCDHLILSYGTFGMMAAWFTDGEVVSADNFTGRPERMVNSLKSVPNLNWFWLPV